MAERSITMPSSTQGVSGDGVPTAADRDEQVVLRGEPHRRDDVGDPPHRAMSAGRRSMWPFQTLGPRHSDHRRG